MTMPETLRAAFVVARRDFTATVFSKTFLLFLLGPLFPIVFGIALGGIGSKVDSASAAPAVAVIGSNGEFERLNSARNRATDFAGERKLVELRHQVPERDVEAQRARLLGASDEPVLGVLEGGLEKPHFTGAVTADGDTVRALRFFIDEARRSPQAAAIGVPLEVTLTDRSSGSLVADRALIARAGQTILFILTILLAGMLLSQLIEEKSNKVIEVLAAAIPVDSVFLGKLFAMLAMSLVGIAVWVGAGAIAIALYASGGLGAVPPPAVGWPAFILLGLAYFSTSYLLIGATFLGIGAQASTVREVQTLSMPVTMAQVMIFGLASTVIGAPDSPLALAAAIFPLSSPMTMIAFAAERPTLWIQAAALAWQVLWVAVILRVGARFFRRNVLKSGPRGKWWRRAKR
ncbi:MAG: ABC transporter permease [Sphingomicrobium sp.]